MENFRKVEPLLSKIHSYLLKKKNNTLTPNQMVAAEAVTYQLEDIGGYWADYAKTLRIMIFEKK